MGVINNSASGWHAGRPIIRGIVLHLLEWTELWIDLHASREINPRDCQGFVIRRSYWSSERWHKKQLFQASYDHQPQLTPLKAWGQVERRKHWLTIYTMPDSGLYFDISFSPHSSHMADIYTSICILLYRWEANIQRICSRMVKCKFCWKHEDNTCPVPKWSKRQQYKLFKIDSTLLGP